MNTNPNPPETEPPVTEPSATGPRSPGSRSRRIAFAAAGLVALTVGGAATVWALDDPGPGTVPAVATVPTTTTTTTSTDSETTTALADHDMDHGTDHTTDNTVDNDESIVCDIPVESHSGSEDHGNSLHDATGGRAVTEEDCDRAEAFYAEVSAEATARFANQADALSAGYRISGEAAKSENPINHYLLAAGNDAELDATLPEGLIYWDDPDSGESLLIGVVFLEQGDDLPQPGGPLTVWHDHHDPESCLAVNPDCNLEEGAANAPRMLHVWFFENVADVFAHDFPGAVGETGTGRFGPLPWQR